MSPPTQPDATQLAERPSELPSQVRAQLLAGQEKLPLRLGERPTKPEESRRGARGSGRECSPRAGRVANAPSLRSTPRPGRTARAPESAHQLAIYDSGREGIELARDRRHGSFIEQPSPFETSPSRMRLRASAMRPMAAAAGSCLVPNSIARRAHWRAPEVAREQPLVVPNDRQPRVNRRLVLILEQTFRPFDPARGPAPAAPCRRAGAWRRAPPRPRPPSDRRRARPPRARAPRPRS